MQAKEIQEHLKTAINAALEAGKAILEIYRTGFTVEYKMDQSPLTTADVASNKIIKDRLSVTKLPLISEEDKSIDYNIRKNWKYFWLIDPLDGTKEFVKENGEFTVNIALMLKDSPIMGVIYAPVPDVLYFAEINTGAYRINDARQVVDSSYALNEIIERSEKLPLALTKRPFTVAGSRSHMNQDTQKYINHLASIHPDLVVITKGSSLKFCAIAEGSADVYPRFGPTMEWDTAAGNAIVNIAGGSVVREGTNEPLFYNKPDLTNPGFIVSR